MKAALLNIVTDWKLMLVIVVVSQVVAFAKAIV